MKYFTHISKLYLVIHIIILSSCWQQKVLIPTYNNATNIKIKTAIADSANNTLPLLDSFRNAMQDIMNVNIGYTNEALKKEKPNSTLGNMVSDAMYIKAKQINKNVVASVANYGGIRIPNIAKGNITLGKIYELMPFDNALCTINLSAALVDTICQHIALEGGMPISNIEFEIRNNKATDIFINKQKLNYTLHYEIAFNDYMANGGDNFTFLKPLKKTLSGILVRDAIIDYIKNCNVNKASLILKPTNRISITK